MFIKIRTARTVRVCTSTGAFVDVSPVATFWDNTRNTTIQVEMVHNRRFRLYRKGQAAPGAVYKILDFIPIEVAEVLPQLIPQMAFALTDSKSL